MRPRIYKFRILTPFILLSSILVTGLVLFSIWSWLNPTDLSGKIILLILTIPGAFVIYMAVNLFFAVLFSFIFLMVVRRKIKSTFRKFAENEELKNK